MIANETTINQRPKDVDDRCLLAVAGPVVGTPFFWTSMHLNGSI